MPLLLLDPLVDAILVIALALVAKKIIEALFSPLTGVAVIGGAISGAINAASKAVAAACGTILGPIDHAVGASLHAMARLTVSVGLGIKDAAGTLADASGLIATIAVAVHGLRNLINHVRGITASVGSTIKTLSRGLHALVHRVTHIEHVLAGGVGHGIAERLLRLEKDVKHLEKHTIHQLEQDVAAIPQDITNYLNGIGLDISKVDTAAFAAAVTFALADIGLGGLSCRSNPLKDNTAACSWWSGIASLLGLAAAVWAVEDFEQLVKQMQGLEADVVTGFKDLTGLG